MPKRIAGLDLGDVWIGVALADPLGISAMPYSTVESKNLIPFLEKFLLENAVSHLIIGYPLTMRGTQSQQTMKIIAQKEVLQQHFSTLKIILWDERLSSERARPKKRPHSKEEKNKIHARAAAVILDSYLFACHEFGRHD